MAPRASSRGGGGDTRTLRSIMLEQLDRKHGKSSSGLFSDVRADFGACGTRRLWHALAWLRGIGAVERQGPAYRPWTRYVRLMDAIPRSATAIRCSVCGARGVTRQSHQRHAAQFARWPRLGARPRASRAAPPGPRVPPER